jgi:hypothetical protein
MEMVQKMTTKYEEKDVTSAEDFHFKNVKLAELTQQAMGNRSLKAYSEATGLSMGFLSRLMNGKLPNLPSMRSLARLTSPAAEPQNNISYEMMLEAAGYHIGMEQEQKVVLKKVERYNRKITDTDNRGAAALLLVLAGLYKMQVKITMLEQLESKSSILLSLSKENTDQVVVVSGVSGRDLEPGETVIQILLRLFGHSQKYGNHAMYLVVTESEEVYLKLKTALKNMPAQICLLRTDLNFEHIVEQAYISEAIVPDERFNFVKEVQ